MRQCLHCEIVKADRLLQVTSTNLILNQNFLSQEVVIKGGPDRLAVFLIITLIIEFHFIAFNVDSMSWVDFPCLIHILHISVKDAEFVQKLGFVEIFGHFFLIAKASLDPRFCIETRICEKFGIVKHLAKVVIVLYPLFILIVRFFFLVHKRCDVLMHVLIARF